MALKTRIAHLEARFASLPARNPLAALTDAEIDQWGDLLERAVAGTLTPEEQAELARYDEVFPGLLDSLADEGLLRMTEAELDAEIEELARDLGSSSRLIKQRGCRHGEVSAGRIRQPQGQAVGNQQDRTAPGGDPGTHA